MVLIFIIFFAKFSDSIVLVSEEQPKFRNSEFIFEMKTKVSQLTQDDLNEKINEIVPLIEDVINVKVENERHNVRFLIYFFFNFFDK